MKTNKFDAGRRRFLRSLGLGSGALVLGPIASSLYMRAMGQQSTAQRFVVVVVSGFPKKGDTTGKLLPRGPNLQMDSTSWSSVETTSFSWPTTLPALQPFRSNSLIVDGLVPLQPQTGYTLEHGAGYGVLTGEDIGLKAEGQIYKALVGGPSIEQQVASGPSGNAPFPSVLFGVNPRGGRNEVATVFAARKGVPKNHVIRANFLENKLFGNMSVGDGIDLRRKRVLDVLKDDIGRLEQNLASEERERLTEYVRSIDQFDARRAALTDFTCQRPGEFGNALSPDEELTALFDVAGIAMKCGITNVLGCAAGAELAHTAEPKWNLLPSGYHVHTNGKWTAGNDALLRFLSQKIAGLLERLSGQPGTMPENTTVVLVSDRGLSRIGNHHGSNQLTHRWPAVVVSSNPKLNTGGRYLRFAQRPDAPAGANKTIAALHATLAHAFDKPGNFGSWAHGPLAELTA